MCQYQSPAPFFPPSPHCSTPHIWLHPVNHASQIAPWSQSTLKWWKWIKLITDSQRESWPNSKSYVWPTSRSSLSRALWWGDLVWFTLPFSSNLHQSTTPTDTPTSPVLNASWVVRHPTTFIQVVGEFLVVGSGPGVSQTVVPGVDYVAIAINQTSCWFFFFFMKHPIVTRWNQLFLTLARPPGGAFLLPLSILPTYLY